MGYHHLIIIYAGGVLLLWLWANGVFKKDDSPREHKIYGWSRERLPRGCFRDSQPYEYRTREHAEEGRRKAIEEIKSQGYKYAGTDEFGQEQYYLTQEDGYGIDQVEKYTSFIKPNYQEDKHGK